MTLLAPPILAHGALGYWDELIFLGVGVLFIGMMVVSWLRSRGLDDIDAGTHTAQHDTTNDKRKHSTSPQADRFELE